MAKRVSRIGSGQLDCRSKTGHFKRVKKDLVCKLGWVDLYFHMIFFF